MENLVVNVAAFAKDKKIRDELITLAEIRTETLNRCYRIAGYEALPLEEKNVVYDHIKAMVMAERKI